MERDATDPPVPSLQASRKRDRQSTDHAAMRAILTEGMIVHVGFVRDGWPVVLPFHYGLADLGDGRGEQMVIHGSTGGRAFLDAARAPEGVAVSACVTLNDGLVLGRRVDETGARYRCVVAYGHARRVPAESHQRALDALMDHIVPGRRDETRPAPPKILVGTALLAIPLDHASAKVAATNTGEAPGDGEDRSTWAGVVPFAVRAGQPVPAAENEHPSDIPPSVRALVSRLNEGAEL